MAGVLEALKVVCGGNTRNLAIETFPEFMNILIHCKTIDDHVT
jgi:hypothetical protein